MQFGVEVTQAEDGTGHASPPSPPSAPVPGFTALFQTHFSIRFTFRAMEMPDVGEGIRGESSNGRKRGKAGGHTENGNIQGKKHCKKQ